MPLKQGNKKTDFSQTSLQMEMANKIEGEVTGWGFWKRCFFFCLFVLEKVFKGDSLCRKKRALYTVGRKIHWHSLYGKWSEAPQKLQIEM